jgi:pilus assembly protein Flp/PilA
MYDKMLKLWIRFRHDDEGVTLVEYGVAVAFAVAAGGLMVSTLYTAFSGALTDAAGAMAPTLP